MTQLIIKASNISEVTTFLLSHGNREIVHTKTLRMHTVIALRAKPSPYSLCIQTCVSTW